MAIALALQENLEMALFARTVQLGAIFALYRKILKCTIYI